MKIQNIQFAGTPNTTTKRQKYESPVSSSMKTAGAWFGFGVGLDYVGRKCSVFKSPTKNSLFINSVLAFLAGTCTFIKSNHSEH